MNLAMAFDFHDIFVMSKESWVKAFKEFEDSEESLRLLEQGTSRKKIAEMLNIDYNKVIRKYREYLEPIKENISFLKHISTDYDTYLVSHSSKERLMMDLEKFNLFNYFKDIFSSEEFENLSQILNEIISLGKYDKLIFFNHEDKNFEEGKVIYTSIDFKLKYLNKDKLIK